MNIESLRSEFPLLQEPLFGGKPLVYLDNAATSQKPRCVLECMQQYYKQQNANIHRGAHYLSRVATEAYEQAREYIAQYLQASSAREIIFSSGTTSAINLVAAILDGHLGAGEHILTTQDAHHSNIVPWQMLAQRRGAELKAIALDEQLQIDQASWRALLSPRTKIIALPAISNGSGVEHPIKELIAEAKAQCPQALILIDGAQSTGHKIVDVQTLGCDFYAFSGHKTYAPTGTGILWGRESLLEQLPPWMGGGEMIREVRFEQTTYNELPFKYEAGTPDIEGNIALARALQFTQELGLEHITAHERALTEQLFEGLSELEGVRVLGAKEPRGSLVSVIVEGVHHYDLGTLLDQMGIAVRTGHLCCQPLMQSLGVTGVTRYSVAAYNTEQEIEAALKASKRALAMLR